MHLADLLARGAQPLAPRLFGALDQRAGRDKILPAGKAGEVLTLLHDNQSQKRSTARDGLSTSEGLHVVRFGTPGNRAFDRAPPLLLVSAEGDLDFNGLAHAGIGAVLLHPRAVGCVRQLLAALREVVRTGAMLAVG